MTSEQEDRLLEDVAIVKRWVETDAPNVMTKNGCASKQATCQRNMLTAAGVARGVWTQLLAVAVLAAGLSIAASLVVAAIQGK